jgi:prophage regulatory protein
MTDRPDQILRIVAVLARTGLGRSTLHRKMTEGSFPRSIAFARRCRGWRESEVNAWIRNPTLYSVDDQPTC